VEADNKKRAAAHAEREAAIIRITTRIFSNLIPLWIGVVQHLQLGPQATLECHFAAGREEWERGDKSAKSLIAEIGSELGQIRPERIGVSARTECAVHPQPVRVDANDALRSKTRKIRALNERTELALNALLRSSELVARGRFGLFTPEWCCHRNIFLTQFGLKLVSIQPGLKASSSEFDNVTPKESS
jgi:hypothetical protein